MVVAPRRGRPRKSAGLVFDAGLRVVRTGLHERAAERLRDMIVRGELAPGATLVEAELSQALGISRTPLREALKLLAQQSLVELRANRSACVRRMDSAEIGELFEALAGIERLAAELAARRITVAALKRLHQLQAEIEQEHDAGRREPYFAANRTIHRLIVEAAGNTPLAEAHAALLARAEQVRFFALRLEDRWEQSIVEHRDILAALEAREAVRAGELLSRHVGHTAAVVAKCLVAKCLVGAPVAASIPSAA